MAKCGFTNCKSRAVHKHHVIYKPAVICPLCRKHHEDITIVNGMQARLGGYEKLTDLQRWQIWVQWLEGKLKAIRNKETLAYIKDWGKQELGCDLDFGDKDFGEEWEETWRR